MASFLYIPCRKQLPVPLTDFARSVLRADKIPNARSICNQKLSPRQELVQCHRILGVKVGSTPDQVRNAFLSLAKRFHPDGLSPEADHERFQEVEKAYRKLQLHFAERTVPDDPLPSDDAGEVTEFDIRHTAPQHRQYLSFDGYGAGTPSQREKQHRKMRAYRATENVFEHRIKKCNPNTEEGLIVKDKIESRKIKTRYGMDRLVEDLIQESMARGDFDNLSGKGKPLQLRSPNPYVDFVTQKMNEVLIDNGFTPEWITLQKEIRIETEELKAKLEKARSKIGPLPLDLADEKAWRETLDEALSDVTRLNSKIDKYNLLVPILHKQMLQGESAQFKAWRETLDEALSDVTRLNSKIDKYNLLVPILHKQMLQLGREAENILKNGKYWPPGIERPKPPSTAAQDRWQSDNLLDLISNFFTAK